MKSKSFTSADLEIRNTFESIGGARALSAWLLYSNGEHQQLVELAFDPFCYNDLESARAALSATSLLSKAKFLDLEIDRRAVALKKFRDAEDLCRQTNRRIILNDFKTAVTPTIIEIAKRKIEWCLGTFEVDEFLDRCEFGPGASTSLKRRLAGKPNKYVFSKDITPEAYAFVKDWFGEAFPEMGDYFFQIVRSSRVQTVPKNAKTDRIIAIEPDWNIFFQKGIGSMIRQRLRGVGIDLNDQTLNQVLAKDALKRDLATVDFSMASDTISLDLVVELLPERWLKLIKAFRSSYSRVDGEDLLLHKFSSMGNGYTFELESLIFWAVASACAENNNLVDAVIGVYGDDVILPRSLVDVYSAVSADLGFKLNTDKSFAASYFRESCGSYYWNGYDVKPMFIKDEPTTDLEFVRIANAVRRLSTRGSHGCDKRFRRCWEFWRNRCKAAPLIPDSLGDGGLVVNWGETSSWLPPKAATRKFPGHEGFLVKQWTESSQEFFVNHRGLLTVRLREIGLLDEGRVMGNTMTQPESTHVRLTTSVVLRWVDIGEWV